MDIRFFPEGAARAVRHWLDDVRRTAAAAASTECTAHSQIRLLRVLDRLGARDHPALTNLNFRRRLERECAQCAVLRSCDRWLASGVREGYEAFCPNAVNFSPMAEGLRLAAGSGR